MKILLLISLTISFFYSILSADEIYLKDSQIIKCEIIQIMDKTIEYKEENGRPFVVIQKNIVDKVIYADGRIEEIAGSNKYDTIYFTDGNVVSGKILQVTPDVIIYAPEDSEKKEAIVRENVTKIIYSDGEEVLITGSETKTEIPQPAIEYEPPPVVKEEAAIQSGGFIDSIIRFGIFGGYGFLWGDLHDKENSAFDRNKSLVPTYPVYPSNYNDSYIEHDKWHGGFEFGLLFPAVKYAQNKRFGLSGVKFGIVSNYSFSYVQQDLNDESLAEDHYTNMLMKYRSINAGPEMNLILGPKSNRVNLVFRFYLLGGYIHQGKLRAVPGLREAGLSLAKSDYSTNFTGYSATAGAGVKFVSNLAFPVVTGIDVQYTYSKINFEHSLPIYNGASSSYFNDICMLMSFGVHI